MKAKSRRRLLISSVAMLLVAMLALGTATFAWFTTSPTAKAEGVNLQASAANGLQILTESHKAWNAAQSPAVADEFLKTDKLRATSADSGTTFVTNATAFYLDPASYAFTLNSAIPTGYKVLADEFDNAAAKDSEKINTAAAGYGSEVGVYAEKIYCKLVGGASSASLRLDSIDITANSTGKNADLRKALRILITYYDASANTPVEKVVGAYSLAATTTTTTNKAIGGTITPGSTTYSSVKSSFPDVTFTSVTDITNPTSIGTVHTAGTDYVGVYVYLDGEDTNCKSSNIDLAQLVSSLTVNLSVPTE